MKNEWEIGAGRITTNLLMVIVDSTSFTGRWNEFFPGIKINGFVFNKRNLYSSIWDKYTVEEAINFIHNNQDFFFSNISKKFDDETNELWKDLEKLNHEIDSLSTRDKNKSRLIELHHRYLRLFGDYAIYTPIVRFSESAIKKSFLDKKFSEERIANLVKPSYKGAQFYLNEELNKIADDILKSGSRQEIEKRMLENNLLEEDYFVYKRLLDIKEKYGWIKSYINFYKDVEISDLLADLISIITNKENQEKTKIEDKIQEHLSEDAINLANKLNFVIDMKNKIQNVQAYIFYLGNKLYSLVSKEIQIPLEKLEWLTENEITSFLRGLKYEDELIDILIEDRKQGILIEPRTGTLIHDKKLIEQIFIQQEIDLEKVFYGEEQEIKGIFINKKEIRGNAFLALSHEELMKKEIHVESILVTRAVTPEYTPYLKKFKAIIADEGGIASHGAIVAREMGISMILGTRNATKLLKDNQEIILNEDGSVERV
jgi:phosphohistidine swiveling domain-containing protein